MSSGGFEYVIGLLFSRGKANRCAVESSDIKKFCHMGLWQGEKNLCKSHFWIENKQRVEGKQLSSVHGGGTCALQS